MIWGLASSRDTPTNEALRLRPWLLFALFLQIVVGALLLSISDLWGFLMSLLVAGFGFQVWRNDLDVHWVMCYGTVVLTQAIFDITHLMVRIHHIPDPFFEKYFWLDVALCSAPFVSAFQTWIMLRAYASFMEEEEAGMGVMCERAPNTICDISVRDHVRAIAGFSASTDAAPDRVHIHIPPPQISPTGSHISHQFSHGSKGSNTIDIDAASVPSPLHRNQVNLLHHLDEALPKQQQHHLMQSMEGMLERQEFDKKYTDFLDEFKPQNFESVSGVIEKLLENQASIASELESLRQKSGTQPSAEVERQASMNTSVHEVEETALQEAQMLTGLANDLRNELEQQVNQPRMSSAVVTKIASLPAEFDALRREQRELAEALAEEFENANATQLTDMACALGEEFDKLQGEKHQLLQGSLVELQQNQAKLAAIVLRQEYKASLSEFTEGESTDKSKLPRSGAEYESLCCFVRAEIDQKLTALREQLSQQVLQTLEAPRAVDATVDAELSLVHQELANSCKAAHAFNEEQLEQLFRITREQAALLEEIRQRQGQVQTLEATTSPFKSWRGDDRSPPMPLPTLSMFVEDEPASGEQTVEGALSVPDTATLSNRLPIVSFTDTSAWQDPVSALIPAQDRLAEQDSPLRAMATSQLPELRQQLALQQVMDDELRRARLALEGMPTFGAPEQFVPKVRAEPEAWEVPDTCAPGDIDSVPLSGRLFALPAAAVPPGLRSQASEDVSPAAESPPASPSQATAPMPTAPDVPTTPPTTVAAASPASPAQAVAAASAATNEQTAAVTTASETSAVPVQQ